jgi:hypothetical protein
MISIRVIHIYMEESEGNQRVANLNKQKCHIFTKMENRRAEQVLSGVLVLLGWRGEECGEKVLGTENGANIVYTCTLMEK